MPDGSGRLHRLQFLNGTVQCSIVDTTPKLSSLHGTERCLKIESKLKSPQTSSLDFLNVDNSYNAYYKFKVNEIKLGIDAVCEDSVNA